MQSNDFSRLRWGILGLGAIAGAFAAGLRASTTGSLTAVGSRSIEKAREFARHHAPGAACFDSYDALLESDTCDAVYIATPHPMHNAWVKKAARCGRHILCEKPAGIHAGEVGEMIEAARANDCFFMEAFMYRCHPLIARLRDIIADGRIGEVRLVRAAFSFLAKRTPTDRLFNRALAGGGILDVGGYPVSFARFIAGARNGLWHEEPERVLGTGMVPPDTGVDEWAAATLRFPGGLLAELFCGVQLAVPPGASIFGTKGWIDFPRAWMASRNGGPASFTIHSPDGTQEVVTESIPEAEAALYGLEADVVAHNLTARQAPPMQWGDSLGNAATLDAWLEAVGVGYRS